MGCPDELALLSMTYLMKDEQWCLLISILFVFLLDCAQVKVFNSGAIKNLYCCECQFYIGFSLGSGCFGSCLG